MDDFVKKCKKCSAIGIYSQNYNVHEENACGGELETVSITCDDLDIISRISNNNDFFQAMIDLKEKDLIEYNLKLSQFKTQLKLQESIQQQQSEQSQVKLRCPYCNSVNVRRISAIEQVSSISMLGMYSRKINKSFLCGSCGGTF